MLTRGRNVGTIEDSLTEAGLSPSKVLGEIERVTGRLAEARVNPGAGGPPIADPAIPSSVENRGLREHSEGGKKPQGGDKRVSFVEQVKREMIAAGTDPAANQEEAFRAVKKKRKSASEKLKARLSRKKRKSTLRTASRMYRKRNKRKIMLRAKKKLAKFGSKMLAKMHKSGKRIVMAHADQALANLREDLLRDSLTEGTETQGNAYEEGATNAGLLAVHLGEVFEVLGENDIAEAMFSMSDVAADLASDLESVSDEMSEEQDQKLRRVIDQVKKGIRVWEEMGSPTLFQAIEFSQAQG